MAMDTFMTPNEQIKALAELDGWKFEKIKKYICGESFQVWKSEYEVLDTWHETFRDSSSRTGYNGRNHPFQTFDDVIKHAGVKDYLHSYDAIIPLVQKQTMDVKLCIERWLGDSGGSCFYYDITPSQLSEALLRACGKWAES